MTYRDLPRVPPIVWKVKACIESIGDLGKLAGVANGTMSRRLADLSQTNCYGAPGLGLITQQTYLYDRRHTRNALSVKGQAVVRQIAGTIKAVH
jgi:hypothetical protein